jgi:ParB/Sulfiredoxin domain
MDIPLTQITIGPRFRQDLGDIAGLAESIKAVGLLHPILVTTGHALIVGRRRLAAHEQLGLKTIEARIVDLDDPFRGEVDENEQRKDYTVSERVAIAEAREERDREEAAKRKAQAGPKEGRGKKKTAPVNNTEPITGESRDITATAVGLSWPTYAKAKKVVVLCLSHGKDKMSYERRLCSISHGKDKMDRRAHSNRNLRFRPPENSWRLSEPDFDFLDKFFGRFSTQNCLPSAPQEKRELFWPPR